MNNSTIKLIYQWLSRQVEPESLTWLEEKRQQIAQGAAKAVLFTSFSAVPRYIEKKDLNLTLEDWQAIEEIRAGWCPYHWSLDQTARTLLILSYPDDNPEEYRQTLEKLFLAADMGELVALYQALPLLPYPEQYRLRAAEGVRSNMTAVFNAVALCNPYPAEYFDNLAWNQMVLKALFVGSPLNLIHRLEERNNPELSQMLIDYIRERLAANRSVPGEIWRAIKPYGNAEIVADLELLLTKSSGI